MAGRLSARLIPKSEALRLLVRNLTLGGGVSSRLLQRLREREPLVYSVAVFSSSNRIRGCSMCIW